MHFEWRIRICREETRRPSIALVDDLRIAEHKYLPLVRVGNGRIDGLQDVALGCRHLGNRNGAGRIVGGEVKEARRVMRRVVKGEKCGLAACLAGAFVDWWGGIGYR